LSIFTSCHFVENGAGYEGGNPYGSIAVFPDSSHGDGGDKDDGQDSATDDPKDGIGDPPGGIPTGFVVWEPHMYNPNILVEGQYNSYDQNGDCVSAIHSTPVQTMTGYTGYIFTMLSSCVNGVPANIPIDPLSTYTMIVTIPLAGEHEVIEVYLPFNGYLYEKQ
jgi:hypothetical protein